MAQEFFSNVTEAMRDIARHLANMDLLTLGLVIAGVALVGYFLLRR